jgi:RNA polymerase subunit RPABC4/transcription elongation factor Spt4
MVANAHDGLACRHCERAIAVPGSSCPWCGKQIMVICANCKQYTPDNLPVCMQCQAPLEEDRMEKVRETSSLRPEVAQLVEDRERAKLVASGIAARYTENFFFDDGQRHTILVDLYDAPPTPRTTAAALLLMATVYLIKLEYCSVEQYQPEEAEEPVFEWQELKPWDGQTNCIESTLAAQAGSGKTVREALDLTVRKEMGFRFEVVKGPLIRTPGMPDLPPARNLSARAAVSAVIELSRRTELPDYDENEACANTYRLLFEFSQANSTLTQTLAATTLDLIDWFIQFEQDPVLALGQ